MVYKRNTRDLMRGTKLLRVMLAETISGKRATEVTIVTLPQICGFFNGNTARVNTTSTLPKLYCITHVSSEMKNINLPLDGGYELS
jgi:hypothetical protein